jgi:anaerobic nitric oxide reductase transcription regulator
VRKLENVLSRAVLKASADLPRGGQVMVGLEHAGIEFVDTAAAPVALDRQPAGDGGRPITLKEAADRFKRDQILRRVAQNNGNWAAAARDLGIHRSNLSKLADRLGIDKEQIFSRRG